ncbi:MAG: carboxypeptidase-like regulatory domain-containing protein [Chitinophagaceae bacterium]
MAQQNFQYAGFQVTGKVTRKSTGEPLSGATVNVKGTNTVTTTNQTGNFSINVPSAGSILVVTYAGMLVQETTVRSAGEVNFSLDDNTETLLTDVS